LEVLPLRSFRQRIESLAPKQIVLLIFVIGLLIRLAFLATKPHTFTHKLQAGDEPLYHGIAVSLAQGRGYGIDGRPTARYGPGYPIFLASVYALVGPRPPAARFANAVAGGALCAVLAAFAMTLWGTWVAFATGMLAAFYYPFIQLSSYLLTENLYLPLFVIAVWLTWQIAGSRKPSALVSVMAGVVWGIAALTRSIALPLTLLCALWLLVRRKGLEVCLLLGAFGLVLSPWVVRNYLVFYAFVPTELSMGHNLYLSFGPPGNKPKVLGHWNWGSDVQRPHLPKGLSPTEQDQWLKGQAWNYIKASPYKALIARIPRKLINLLTPFYGTASVSNKVLMSFCYLLLLTLSLPAWWRSWRSDNFAERSFAELTLLVILFTVVFHALTFGVVRYRYPIDALLLIFTGRRFPSWKEP
jgi:4-amino-4-deoxy-L-arabinose transferase-like glycosyltransferase